MACCAYSEPGGSMSALPNQGPAGRRQSVSLGEAAGTLCRCVRLECYSMPMLSACGNSRKARAQWAVSEWGEGVESGVYDHIPFLFILHPTKLRSTSIVHPNPVSVGVRDKRAEACNRDSPSKRVFGSRRDCLQRSFSVPSSVSRPPTACAFQSITVCVTVRVMFFFPFVDVGFRLAAGDHPFANVLSEPAERSWGP